MLGLVRSRLPCWCYSGVVVFVPSLTSQTIYLDNLAFILVFWDFIQWPNSLHVFWYCRSVTYIESCLTGSTCLLYSHFPIHCQLPRSPDLSRDVLLNSSAELERCFISAEVPGNDQLILNHYNSLWHVQLFGWCLKTLIKKRSGTKYTASFLFTIAKK